MGIAKNTQRILIFGGTGMLGHRLWRSLSQRYEDCWVTVRGPRARLAQHPLFDDSRVIDEVSVEKGWREALDRVQPTILINCVAVTTRHVGHSSQAMANVIQANAEFPHRLAAWANPQGARVFHFSTDCVFDGRKGGYTESDPSNAADLYGRTKALGELSASEGRCLTLRCSLIGRELFQHTELLEWFLQQKGMIRGYRNALYTGVAVWVMVDLIERLIEKHPDLSGLYHVASQTLSKYDLLRLAKEVFGSKVEIEADDQFTCKRNLDGSRFREATGWEAPSWPEMMKGIADGR